MCHIVKKNYKWMPNTNFTKEVALSNHKKKKNQQRGGTRKVKRIKKKKKKTKLRASCKCSKTIFCTDSIDRTHSYSQANRNQAKKSQFFFSLLSTCTIFFCYTHKYLHDMFFWYPIWSLRSLIFFYFYFLFFMGYNLITLPIALFVSEHRQNHGYALYKIKIDI